MTHTVRATPLLRSDVITGFEAFLRLKSSWDRLVESASVRSPTLAHGWLSAWWRAFGGEAQLLVFVVWRGEDLVAALPLMRRSDAALYSLTNSWVDRSPTLFREKDEEALSCLVDTLCSTVVPWNKVVLTQRIASLSQDDRMADLLRAKGLLVGVDDGLRSPFLPLTSTWEALLDGLSSSFRQTLRRKLRAAENFRGVEMQIYRDADVVNPIMEISAHTWQHDNGTSMASTPVLRAFFESVIGSAAADGHLYSSVLFRDGVPVAFEFNIRSHATLHNFKLGYRREESDWSPGMVLKALTIRRFIEEFGPLGLAAEYDMMGTTEPYKLQWTKSVREHHNLTVFRPSVGNFSRFAWRYRCKPALRVVRDFSLRLVRGIVR